MSMPFSEMNQDVIASLEADEVLRLAREGIVRYAYGRLDEAMALEAEQERVYVMDAVVDIPDEEALAVMLTRDGVRPFREEAKDKEQIILYFISSSTERIWIEHIREGEHSQFSLDSHSLNHQEEVDEPAYDALPHLESEASDQDTEDLIKIKNPVSDMARLSVLREKIERFLLTPQQ